jgi:hypothetical protein
MALAWGSEARSQSAHPQDSESLWKDAGKGTATAAANLLYMPAKLVYAGVGGLVGGLAYGVTLGDQKVAQNIWEPSVGGKYILSTNDLFPESQPGGQQAYRDPYEQPLREYDTELPK